MANHGKLPSQRSKSYWTRHYNKKSRIARKEKRKTLHTDESLG